MTIPEPLYLGEARGHPFLVGTFLAGEVLASTLSGPARLWKRALINPPASWLLALGKQTRRRISSDRLAHAVVTLERAARSRDLDDLVRRKASRAAHILQSYAPGIPCVVQHGDFHAENILTNGWNTITGIVDWVDAIIEGFPGVDLLQFAASVGLRDRTRDRMLDVYANGLGVSAQLCCALSVAHWLEVRLRLNGVFSHHELARSVRTIDQLLLTELRQLGGPSKES